jgi:hypothetical protein
MNERIKQLMIQADYPAPELALRAHRLAELIVRECADFVAAGEFGDPGTAKMLMEDFGVEE